MANPASSLPQGQALERNIKRRKLVGKTWESFFLIALIIAFLALILLTYSIINQAFGVVAEDFRNNPDGLAEQFLTVPRQFDSLSDLEKEQVAVNLFEGNPEWLRLLTAEVVLGIDRANTQRLREIITIPFSELANEPDITAFNYPPELADVPFGMVGQLPSVEQYIAIIDTHLGSEGFNAFVRQAVADYTFATEIGTGQEIDLDDFATLVLGRVPSPSVAFDDLNEDQLSTIATTFFANNEARLRVLVLDWVLGVTRNNPDRLRSTSDTPVGQLLEAGNYPERLRDVPIGNPPLSPSDYQQILFLNLDDEQLRDFVLAEVAQLRVVKSWPLREAVFNYSAIEAEIAADNDLENATLKFRSWVNLDFFAQPMNSRAELAGIRTALFGSIWLIGLTILIAFPVGIGAAIYLEEYAAHNRLNSIIQTNIYNLAGVPSIIYGILGLAVFVRVMEPITSGTAFGFSDPTTANGRTIISAALTMSLLILPIIIISSQEALRAVPSSLRQASLGLGATQWQTIWNHVLPYALPGILTGTILAVSRAIGETAPLIVVGAASYITANPTGPFSKFTVLPIQIYRWTSEPARTFRNTSAAAIVVLLTLLLMLNATAIILRNRFSRS